MTIITPFSLKDAPSLIEKAWPTSKISEEVQKERKAGSGQTLTGLGCYWKGRKPLILTRACLIASLMPANDTPEGLAKDVEIFEKIMAFDEQAMRKRLPVKKLDLLSGTYRDQVLAAKRPEEMDQKALLDHIWDEVNAHLKTDAQTIPELVEQLGIMRFGHRPKVADTFSGSGSIPFEAGRIGCDVYASDLNPIACMLTWGSFNIVGASDDEHCRMTEIQDKILKQIDDEIVSLKIEHDEQGNRAKVYLYCLETRCPRTGYMVPMAPSWIISKQRNVVAKLIPDHDAKRYGIEIISNVSETELNAASEGTVQNGRLYHPVLDDKLGVSIKEIRGDYKEADGQNRNKLRLWNKSDFAPRSDDIWQERLYCIQWLNGKDLAAGKANARSWFAAPTEADLQREERVKSIVGENLSSWQETGFVPDMEIEHGAETTRLYRERGWTHWHHLFGPRHLLVNAIATKYAKKHEFMYLGLGCLYNQNAKTCAWATGKTREAMAQTFSNQAINTLWNHGARGFRGCITFLTIASQKTFDGKPSIKQDLARNIDTDVDIIITDPPYADAVQYDEITEFFIAWLRKNPPAPFDEWIWDSRRAVAIKGSDHAFKTGMIEAYKAMTDHMSDNGLQIVQFTHQDNSVWADMAQIFWGAGLQVVQDWVVSTETTSELKQGGYVQGTHNIVCRKRQGARSGYSDEIYHEIEDEVHAQIAQMTGLNQTVASTGTPNIFNDDDIQTAGYAAALRVLTSYTRIDGEDMASAAMRPRRKGEKGVVDKLVEHAAKVAAQALAPHGVSDAHWRSFNNSERFYLKMVDMESRGPVKLDIFQRFSTAYGVLDKDLFMASSKANDAKTRTAGQFGRNALDHAQFGKSSPVRLVLRAMDRIERNHETDDVITELRDLLPDYIRKHELLVAIASYIAERRKDAYPTDAASARILRSALMNARV